MFLLSRRGAVKLSATVFLLSGLGFSGLVLFSNRVRVRGSFKVETQQKQIIISKLKVQFKQLGHG